MKPENPTLVRERFRQIVEKATEKVEQEWKEFEQRCKENPDKNLHKTARWSMTKNVELAQIRKKLKQKQKEEIDVSLEPPDDFEDKASWETVTDRKYRGYGKESDDEFTF